MILGTLCCGSMYTALEKSSDAPETSVFGYYWERKDPRRTGPFQYTKSSNLFEPGITENIQKSLNHMGQEKKKKKGREEGKKEGREGGRPLVNSAGLD